MNDAELAREVSRVMVDYSEAWEGHVEEVAPLGDGLARWNGAAGFAMPSFSGEDIDGQLDRAVEELEGTGRRYLWMISPLSEPAGLGDRLTARGFKHVLTWDGLVLEDLSVPVRTNSEVLVREPIEEDAEAVGMVWAPGPEDEAARAHAAESLRRYVRTEPKEARIFLGCLDGRVVTYTSTRLEPNGTAYLRQGATLPEFQGRGVYTTILARRLEAARAAGCTRVVVQAIHTTSSPILQKYGFRRVCGLEGYVQPLKRPQADTQAVTGGE